MKQDDIRAETWLESSCNDTREDTSKDTATPFDPRGEGYYQQNFISEQIGDTSMTTS